MTTLATPESEGSETSGTGWATEPPTTVAGHVDLPDGGRGCEPFLAARRCHSDVRGEELFLYHFRGEDQRFTGKELLFPMMMMYSMRDLVRDLETLSMVPWHPEETSILF